jgi:hypothetical protein
MPFADHVNFLVAQASGEFFLGLSDDDYIESDFVGRVLELFDRIPGLSFVYTACIVHYGRVAVPSLFGPPSEQGPDFIAAFFAGQRELCWCGCVMRLADLKNIVPLPAGQICVDMYFWIRLAFQGDVGCVPAPVSHYTFMTEDNLSAGTPVLVWAKETSLLTDEACARFQAARESPGERASLRRDCRAFVARSTANQIMWNAVRGSDRRLTLKNILDSMSYLTGGRFVWVRAMAALILPRRWTRRLILRAAARLAVRRTGDQVS